MVFARYGGDSFGCRKHPVGTAEVGARSEFASPAGILDMAGNVWEWTTDRTAAGLGILRGGGWDSSESGIAVRASFEMSRDGGEVSTGFRCVREPNAAVSEESAP